MRLLVLTHRARMSQIDVGFGTGAMTRHRPASQLVESIDGKNWRRIAPLVLFLDSLLPWILAMVELSISYLPVLMLATMPCFRRVKNNTTLDLDSDSW